MQPDLGYDSRNEIEGICHVSRPSALISLAGMGPGCGAERSWNRRRDRAHVRAAAYEIKHSHHTLAQQMHIANAF